MANLRDIAFL